MLFTATSKQAIQNAMHIAEIYTFTAKDPPCEKTVVTIISLPGISLR
jgi:hypothetical protein